MEIKIYVAFDKEAAERAIKDCFYKKYFGKRETPELKSRFEKEAAEIAKRYISAGFE